MNRRLLRTRLALSLAVTLAGCTGTPFALPNRDAPAPMSFTWKIEPAFATTLQNAPPGTTTAYKRPDGMNLTLTLGASYTSARAQTCRVGRDDEHQMAYGFCLASTGWYGIAPVALTGS
jgi:hypothetical protein